VWNVCFPAALSQGNRVKAFPRVMAGFRPSHP
jgi:hypothetical protein